MGSGKRFATIFLLALMVLGAGCASPQKHRLRASDTFEVLPPPEPPVLPQQETLVSFPVEPLILPTLEEESEESSSLLRQMGIASWYGGWHHGRKTASGERYNKAAYTAAHRTLPFNTLVKVHNLENNQEVVVRITDRGPYIKGRIIDLSEAAARRIGMYRPGLARVEVEVLPVR